MLKVDLVDVLGAGRDPASITRQELVRLMDRVRDGVPGRAKPRPGSVSTFKARVHGLFEEALRRGVVSMNPLAGHRAPRRSRTERIEAVKRRTGRALDMNEVAALWRACEDPGVNPTFGLYVRMLLITGARRAELAAARQSWLKPPTLSHPPLLVFPAESVKNGTEHVVPLPQLAVNLLASVQRRAFSDLLFREGICSTVPARTQAEQTHSTLRSCGGAGLVKRGRCTTCEHGALRRARRRQDVCEALLNHTPGTRAHAYDPRDFLAEKAQALELWAADRERDCRPPGRPMTALDLGWGVILWPRARRPADARRSGAQAAEAHLRAVISQTPALMLSAERTISRSRGLRRPDRAARAASMGLRETNVRDGKSSSMVSPTFRGASDRGVVPF
jgi:integrase